MPVFARWIASMAIAAALGAASLMPTPARASDDLVRVIVDAADVILRGGMPYYRHGGAYDRVIVERDRYGRPVYYRYAPRGGHVAHYRTSRPVHLPPPAYRGHHRHGPPSRNVRCDSRGRCTAQYYDPRYDRKGRGRHW